MTYLTALSKSEVNCADGGNRQIKVNVHFRHETVGRKTKCECINCPEGTTILYLKSRMTSKLNQHPYIPGFVLESNQIRVFQESGGPLLEPLCDTVNLVQDATYVAMEYFTTAPVDMFRTVAIQQLYPAIYSDPEHVDRSYSNFSPLCCAAMKESEQAFPAICLKKNKVVAHGVSLRCADEATRVDDLHPFRQIETDEAKGKFSVSLQDYQRLIPDTEGRHSSGIICSSLTHKFKHDKYYCGPKTHNSKMQGKKRTRRFFFRYLIKKGTNLSGHKLAFVFDNSSAYHCSMVREVGDNGLDIQDWDRHFEPVKMWPKNRQFPQVTDPRFQEEVRVVLAPTDRPKAIICEINPVYCLVFPAVAALFQLHDFVMDASAEPVPLDQFEDEQQRRIFLTVKVLYHSSLGDFQLAMEELETANYKVEKVATPCLMALLQAVDQVLENDDVSEWDEAELGFEPRTDLHEVLLDGMRILENATGEGMSVKTPGHFNQADTLAQDSPDSHNTK